MFFISILFLLLLAAGLASWELRSPAVECAITDAIALAERILSKIDAKWPKRETA